MSGRIGRVRGLAMVARDVPARMGGVVVTCASVPQDVTDPLQSMPICTTLFNNLGIAAPVCAVIAIAVLPLMKRLALAHRAEMQGG